MSLYTYQIDYGAGWVAATPVGEWTITPTQNTGQIFFRNVFEGDLTFSGSDYDTIIVQTDCEVLEFRILCDAVEYWVGRFKFPYDLTIDEDTCTLVGTPEVVDEYNCIMDHYETQYQILPPTPVLAQIRTCGGALLHTLPQSGLLGASTVSGDAGYIDETVNGLNTMNCGLDMRSSFMWLDAFPNGTPYAGAYGVNNYIEGLPNKLADIYLQTNSSARNSFGGTSCDLPRFSPTFKQLETLLRNAFNAYWFIDENGDFRIEHIHYFDVAFPESDYVNSPDLQTVISSNGKSFAYRRNKYTYETGELYDQERWTWQHYRGTEGTVVHGGDFEGQPVYYGTAENIKSTCVPGVFKEKEIASPQFWADIEWGFGLVAAGTPDTIACGGWCMLWINRANSWIRCQIGAYNGVTVINGHLSTANLQAIYHTYDRIFLAGHMNNGATPPATETTVFDSAKPLQLQESIEFTICCDDIPDPMNRIVTELGNGKVKSMKINQNSVEVELLY